MSAETFVRCIEGQLGKPYHYATAGPNSFDCSGLVAFCYEQTQHEPISRSSVTQFTLGERVAPGEALRPGDLAFWDTFGEAPGHVAVVSSDGESIIHAMNEERGVTRSANIHVNMGGAGRFVGVRRLFTDDVVPTPGGTSPSGPPPKVRRRPKRHKRRPRMGRE